MTMVSGSSQSNMGSINLENWSNSSIKPSSSVILQTGAWLDGSFSPAFIASITSFTDDSDEVESSCWHYAFFLKLYLSPIFPKKHLNVSILTDIALLDLFHWDTWNERVPIETYCCWFCYCEIYLVVCFCGIIVLTF